MSETFEMVAKTLYGLEEILAGELLSLGANDIQIGRRMVSFTGDKEVLYKANFYCRTALRILKPIYHFKAKDADTVYKEVKKVKWENYMSLDKTFAIDSVIYSEDFNHSKFVAYRTKDAIVDYFMEKDQKRPSVRVNNPDLYINIHISHNDCTLSIDSSGESLHKRGYRVDQTEAPLNEVLAAGMILKTGWKGESNFVDPMCGSGTLLIEAAMIALILRRACIVRSLLSRNGSTLTRNCSTVSITTRVRNVSLISNVMVPISIRRRSRLPRRISVVPA